SPSVRSRGGELWSGRPEARDKLLSKFLPALQKKPRLDLTIRTVEGLIDRLVTAQEAALSEFQHIRVSPEGKRDKFRKARLACVERASHLWFGLAAIIDNGDRGRTVAATEDLSIPIGLAAFEGRLAA